MYKHAYPHSSAAFVCDLTSNRRKTKGVGRIAARTIEQLVARPTLTMKMLIRETVPCRAFRANGIDMMYKTPRHRVSQRPWIQQRPLLPKCPSTLPKAAPWISRRSS
jgi:hypothetical protein